MNGFILTNISAGGVRVISKEPNARKRDWDEYNVVVEGRLTETQMRAAFPMGRKLNVGLGFYLQDLDFAHAGAGLNRASLVFRGLFARKVWGEAGAALAVRNMDDLLVGTSTTVAKAAVLDVTPTFTARVYDATEPPYSQIGKRVSAPPTGLVFPVAAGAGPWTFWGSYVPTTNVLVGITSGISAGGWAITDVQNDEISGDTAVLGSINQLHGKTITHTLFWPQVP